MQLSLVSTYHPCRGISGGREVSGFLLLGFCSETQKGINSITVKTSLPGRLILAWQLLQGVPAHSPLAGTVSMGLFISYRTGAAMKLSISTPEDAQGGQVMCLREHSKNSCSTPCLPSLLLSLSPSLPLCRLLSGLERIICRSRSLLSQRNNNGEGC